MEKKRPETSNERMTLAFTDSRMKCFTFFDEWKVNSLHFCFKSKSCYECKCMGFWVPLFESMSFLRIVVIIRRVLLNKFIPKIIRQHKRETIRKLHGFTKAKKQRIGQRKCSALASFFGEKLLGFLWRMRIKSFVTFSVHVTMNRQDEGKIVWCARAVCIVQFA